MTGWIWQPGSAAGTMIEVPARAPNSPANLWIHVATNNVNWADLSTFGDVLANWRYSPAEAIVTLEPGDIPVASLACVGLAGIQREEQGVLDTDTWGVALNSLAPAGPGATIFFGEFATAGKCWPGEVWFIADILVARPSLIPPVPVPYGTYPAPPRRWNWPFEKYIELVRNIGSLTKDQLDLFRRLNRELEELLASDKFEQVEPPQRPVSKPAMISLKIGVPAGMSRHSGEEPTPGGGSRRRETRESSERSAPTPHKPFARGPRKPK